MGDVRDELERPDLSAFVVTKCVELHLIRTAIELRIAKFFDFR